MDAKDHLTAQSTAVLSRTIMLWLACPRIQTAWDLLTAVRRLDPGLVVLIPAGDVL
jgi:hypothetical protein